MLQSANHKKTPTTDTRPNQSDKTTPHRDGDATTAVADFAFPDYVTVRPSLHQRLPATAPALAFRRLDLTIVERERVLSGDWPKNIFPPNVPLACQALLCIVWQGAQSEKKLCCRKSCVL